MAKSKPSQADAQPKPLPTPTQIKSILDRANRLDQRLGVDEVRDLLQAVPALVEVNGSPAQALTDRLLRDYSPNLVIREAVRLKMEQMRSELAGVDPSPLVALLAERVAVCWLAAHIEERDALGPERSRPMPMSKPTRPPKAGPAHRRFFAAVRMLATVRKLT